MQTPMNYILLKYIIIKLAMMVQLQSFGLSEFVFYFIFSLTKLLLQYIVQSFTAAVRLYNTVCLLGLPSLVDMQKTSAFIVFHIDGKMSEIITSPSIFLSVVYFVARLNY